MLFLYIFTIDNTVYEDIYFSHSYKHSLITTHQFVQTSDFHISVKSIFTCKIVTHKYTDDSTAIFKYLLHLNTSLSHQCPSVLCLDCGETGAQKELLAQPGLQPAIPCGDRETPNTLSLHVPLEVMVILFLYIYILITHR